MNVTLIAAAMAAMGLAACSPDITPPGSAAPARPAAEQNVAQADKPLVSPAAQEERKDAAAPAVDAKKDDGGKKVD
ncbi:MAG: hypothetical protein OEW21_18065 [Betaproteobacteria bacterium]|nr:hypothetical protein [Betaproteobacteria bacterium]